jgi:integrase
MAYIEERRTADKLDANGNVIRRGKVHYRVQIRIKGQPPITRTFDCKTDAAAWAKEQEVDIDPGRRPRTTKERKRTLADLIDKYLAEAVPKKVHNKDKRNLEARLGWWRDQIGYRYLIEIAPADIAECRDRLEQQTNRYGNHLSGATINRYLAALGAAFKYAVKERHWLDASPVGNVGRRAESAGRTRFLDDDERKRLMAACRASDHPELHLAVTLAITTGMRKGEILSLRWPHVDLKRSLVQLIDTKNGSARTVPLPKIAAALLEQRGKVRSLTDDRVFTEKRDFDLAWRNALAAAEINDFRFHDLRHTAASYLAMHGATLAELAEVLGHKTLQMVKRYSHLTEQHKRGLIDRMAVGVFGDD